MTYKVTLYKPSGKYYMVDEPIIDGDYCLYTTIPEIIENKYKNKINQGWLILVEDESGASHIFNK